MFVISIFSSLFTVNRVLRFLYPLNVCTIDRLLHPLLPTVGLILFPLLLTLDRLSQLLILLTVGQLLHHCILLGIGRLYYPLSLFPHLHLNIHTRDWKIPSQQLRGVKQVLVAILPYPVLIFHSKSWPSGKYSSPQNSFDVNLPQSSLQTSVVKSADLLDPLFGPLLIQWTFYPSSQPYILVETLVLFSLLFFRIDRSAVMALLPRNTSRIISKKMTKKLAKPAGVLKKTARKQHAGKWPDVSTQLFHWYHQQKGSVPDSSVRSQAAEIFQSLYQGKYIFLRLRVCSRSDNYTETELPKFSDAWMKAWKAKYASFYAEKMLAADMEKVAITESRADDSASHPTLSSVIRIEPSNEARIMKFVKATGTILASNHLAGLADSAGSCNHEVHTSHELSTEHATGNTTTSTRAEPHMTTEALPISRDFNETAAGNHPNGEGQRTHRMPPNVARERAFVSEVHRDEVVTPGFNVVNGSQQLPSTREIGSLSHSATLSMQGQVEVAPMGITLGELSGQAIGAMGGDEGEDLGGRGLISEAGSLASTRVIESYPSSFHGTTGGDLIEPVSENESLASTLIIASYPSSPVALSQGRAAFGAWAFDAEVQDAPSFTFPEFPDDESMASTVIINY